MIGFYAAGAMGQGGGGSYFDSVMADNPALYLRFIEPVSGAPANSGGVSLTGGSYNNSTRGRPSLSGDAGDYSVGVSTGAGTRGPHVAFSSGSVGKANNFTIEAIIRPTDLSGGHVIFSGSGNNAPELRIISGKINLIRRNTAVVAASSSTLSTSARYHVACRIASDGTYTFFLNGSTDGSGAGYASFYAAYSAVEVGYESIIGNIFVGDIDEVAVYHSALSDARIAAHAAAAGL